VARVKAFNKLFAGADNTAIGSLGEAIAMDVMLMLGAQAVTPHALPDARRPKASAGKGRDCRHSG
jgi:hypothetical protein